MKNLANCKPSEFLRQTNKIRKAVSNWLEITKIMEIRKEQPEYIELTIDMTPDEREATIKKNKEAKEKKVKENLSAMLDSMLEDHPDETLEILGLLCFIEPEDVDNHDMTEYIQAMNDLLENQAVLGFFTSLMQLGAKAIPGASKP